MGRWVKRVYERLSECANPVARAFLFGTILIALSVACARQYGTGYLFGIGQTAEVDGWQVTVHSFSVLPADPWHQAAVGQVFCAVELTLENNSGQIRFVMPEKQMILLDGNGQAYAPDRNAAVVAARSRQWIVPEGELSIGERAHGAAAYQIPGGSKGMCWIFRSNLFPWARSVAFVVGELETNHVSGRKPVCSAKDRLE